MLENVNQGRAQATPMTHLQFRMSLCEALLEGWEMRDVYAHDLPLVPDRPLICTPTYNVLQKNLELEFFSKIAPK